MNDAEFRGSPPSLASPLSSEDGCWLFSTAFFLIKGCNFFLQVFQIVAFSNHRCLRPASESAEIRKVLHIPPALPYTECSKQLSGIFYLGLNSNSFSSPDSHILQMKLTLLDLRIFFFFFPCGTKVLPIAPSVCNTLQYPLPRCCASAK